MRRIKFIKRREVYIKRCMMDTNQTVAKKSKQFAIHIMKLVEHLRMNKHPFFIQDQVGRSGTSIGANVAEAEHAISKKEFLQRMYIAYKECNETLYWLELIFESDYISGMAYHQLRMECEELEKMLSAITKTTAENLRRGGAI